MRNLLAIFAFALIAQVFGQTAKNDTTFLLKENIDGELHTIFIDDNKNSKYYGPVSNFKFGEDGMSEDDRVSYKLSLDYLMANGRALARKTPIVPWKAWVTLKQYKGKFYAYYPCDFYFRFSHSVNDTTFIDWTGEGPVANRIIYCKKIDLKTFEFQLDGINEKARNLKIHVIDEKRGIAVFEQRKSEFGLEYYLMIAAEKIRSVPIIVNYCPTQKQTEFKFETPDYKSMLKSK
jgi:hypothetical protein